ncbi:MAG: T9SS type A sorting domain-containing protein, partial [Bacteroidia bacterium]
HVFVSTDQTRNTRFENLVFTKGYGNGGCSSPGFGGHLPYRCAGGAVNHFESSPTYYNCVFKDNYASFGGAIVCDGIAGPAFENCVFDNNSASVGGAVSTLDDDIDFINCTFISNSAATNGGALSDGTNNTMLITNCLFYGNTGGSTPNISGNLRAASTNNAADQSTAIGDAGTYINLSSTTSGNLFEGYSNGNGTDNQWMTVDDGFTPKRNTDVITNGTSTVAPEKDLTGFIRRTKPTIGAYENQSCLQKNTLPIASDSTYTSSDTSIIGDWTNYCAENGELLLSLKLASTGLSVSGNGVELKLGKNTAFGLDTSGGLVASLSGYAILDRRWNVTSTGTQTSNPSIRYYFTDDEYNSLKTALDELTSPITIDTVTELKMYQATSGVDFADPHTVSGNLVHYDSTTASTTQWIHNSHGATDHIAQFELNDFSGSGGGALGLEPILSRDTLYVNDQATGQNDGSSWNDAYTDLQVALDDAIDSSKILIAEGTYIPTYTLSGSTATLTDSNNTFHIKDKDVSLYGGWDPFTNTQSGENTILSGNLSGNSSNTYHVFVSVGQTNGTVYDRLVIKGGVTGTNTGTTVSYDGVNINSSQGGGMYVLNSSPIITNCVFEQNKAVEGGGVFLSGNSSTTFTNCVFVNDTATTAGGGVKSTSTDTTSIVSCTFVSNDGTAISQGGSGKSTLRNTLFYDNTGSTTHNYAGNTLTTLSTNNATDETSGAGNAIQQASVSTFIDLSSVASSNVFSSLGSMKGVDNQWATNDDGLIPEGFSLIYESGSSVNSLTTDITGDARASTPTIGAYKASSEGQYYNQLQKLVDYERGNFEGFGRTVALYGDYAIVGAPGESHDSAEMDSIQYVGAAFIYKRNGSTWELEDKIVSNDRGRTDYFGWSVGLYEDYAIVGAPGHDDPSFGWYNSGIAYIYKRNGTNWVLHDALIPPDRASDDDFGKSVAIDGEYAIVGAENNNLDSIYQNNLSDAGAVYIFKKDSTLAMPNNWSREAKLVASNRSANSKFGNSVDISGDYAIVSAFSGLGSGNQGLNTYIYKRTGTVWTEQKVVTSDNSGVAEVSIDGDYALLGTDGAAFSFINNGSQWVEDSKLVSNDYSTGDGFGYVIDMSGNYAVISAVAHSHDKQGVDSISYAGAAYIFKRNGSSWTQIDKIVASDRGVRDNFGESVGISNNYVIVGTSYEDHNALGLDSLNSSGSVYFYGLDFWCLSDNPLPTNSNRTYVGGYTSTDTSGWTHYCSNSDELLLSLKLGNSGAIVNADEVRLRLGDKTTFGYLGPDAGMVNNNDEGYQMIDRKWDASPTTQPTSGNVGVRYYFTNQEYLDLKDSLLLHGPNQNAANKSTLTASTDISLYKSTTGSPFADPHTVNGIIIANGSTPSTTVWKHSTHGSSDHIAEFEVSSFSGGGGGGGGGGGANPAPLPVELIHFTATPAANHSANLNWVTASELNNSHFEVLRSYDGRSFEPIDFVSGNGTTNDISEYVYTDRNIDQNAQVVYYRLRQVDYNGDSELSDIRVVNFSEEASLEHSVSVHPNPTRDILYITLTDLDREAISGELLDINGRMVQGFELSSSITAIDMSSLLPGMYYVRINTETEVKHVKITKQ